MGAEKMRVCWGLRKDLGANCAVRSMPADNYNPERDVSPAFLATVMEWIKATGEVFVVLRYLWAAGSKDYGFIANTREFETLVSVLPIGTDIIVFRKNQLPIRGIVDEPFIETALAEIEDGTEFLIVETSPEKEGDSRLHGTIGDSHDDLIESLNDYIGMPVSLGPCPHFNDPDNEDMISAAKGGIDGPR